MPGRVDQPVALVLLQDGPALFSVRSIEADHHRGLDLHPAESCHDPIRDLFAPRDSAENVDEDRLHTSIRVDDFERIGAIANNDDATNGIRPAFVQNATAEFRTNLNCRRRRRPTPSLPGMESSTTAVR